MNLVAAIESLLFVAGEEGLTLEELVQLLEVPTATVQYKILKLAEKYDLAATSGIELILIDGRYQLVTKKEFADVIKQYAISPFAAQLSQAALETLAIIAYRQPVTRLDIDDIRGVQSSAMIKKLVHRDLVKEQGRKETPGRPILYVVTEYFYQYFGLQSLEDLPDLNQLLSQEDLDETTLFSQIELRQDSDDSVPLSEPASGIEVD